MLNTLVVLMLMLCSPLAYSTDLNDFTTYLGSLPDSLMSKAPSRTVLIEGGMDDESTAAAQLNELADTAGPIKIIINSPGGFVYVARDIIEAMQRAELSGAQVTCVVTGDAMSAAWVVFNACPRRQAYSFSRFLWHSVATPMVGYYNILQLRKQLSYLEGLQAEFNTYLSRELQIPDALFTKWWTSEITVTGAELSIASPRYLTIVKDR